MRKHGEGSVQRELARVEFVLRTLVNELETGGMTTVMTSNSRWFGLKFMASLAIGSASI